MEKIPSYILFTEEPGKQLDDLIKDLLPDKVGILVDENTKSQCLTALSMKENYEIIEINSGEKHKNLQTCSDVWSSLTKRGFSRKSLLINLGGGVIGDMGGFIASTYKRGIRFVNIPTTLLAQVDASIGGKLGIDFEGLKNHIGLFNEPEYVIVSSHFLSTLPLEQLRSGFAEVIKHALIHDEDYWKMVTSIHRLDSINWLDIIKRSIEVKNEIVSLDPKEKGFRKVLNFGHTLGHAIETWYLHNELNKLHGEAVAAGMILESKLSEQISGLNPLLTNQIGEYIKLHFTKTELPPFEEVIRLMGHDKKNENGQINFSLLKNIGQCEFDREANEEMIYTAFQYYERLYK